MCCNTNFICQNKWLAFRLPCVLVLDLENLFLILRVQSTLESHLLKLRMWWAIENTEFTIEQDRGSSWMLCPSDQEEGICLCVSFWDLKSLLLDTVIHVIPLAYMGGMFDKARTQHRGNESVRWKEGNKEQREHFASPHLGSVMYETWQVVFYSYSIRVESNFPVLELRKVLVNYFTNQICFKWYLRIIYKKPYISCLSLYGKDICSLTKLPWGTHAHACLQERL